MRRGSEREWILEVGLEWDWSSDWWGSGLGVGMDYWFG